MTKRQDDDPRALVEGAWRQIYATDAKLHPNRLNPGAPRFIDYAWKTFDPRMVMAILTSEAPTYAALKPILFSGLCTWVVCPRRDGLRQHGMLLTGIEHLRSAETDGRKVFAGRDMPGHELLGDILGRVRVLGQDFFSDFYYPIGGLAQVLRSTTPGNFRRSLTKHARDTLTIVTLMQIFDHHTKHLGNRALYYQASQGKGFELVRDLYRARGTQTGSSVEISKDRWKALGGNAALIYAASTIPESAGQSLLNAICAGEATYEKHGHLLRTWISRARYSAKFVLGGMFEPSLGHEQLALLPDLPSNPTPEPPFSEAERAQIEAEFKIAAILGARRK